MTAFVPPPKTATPQVLILGAGMSGILAGIKLKEEGIESFEILEMGGDVGGTWRDNTYPGLSCDVPAHSYDYSFEHNWRWKSTYAEGAEIHAYFKHCSDKYGVTPHVRLNTRVTSVVREKGAWTVTTADGVSRRADIVINCLGVLVHPMTPDIPGLESFKGARFHSARWDHSVPLDGKKIGVIGTGSTATQITVALADRAKHFTMFQRTAQWVSPNFDTKRPAWLRGLHRAFPGLSAVTGKFQNWILERIFCRAVVGDKKMQALLQYFCDKHLASVKDPVLREKLTPKFKLGCRRLIFSDKFYDAIQKPNVALVTEGIERIEPNGVRTKDGKLHELDVLVTATGFHALDYTRNLVIRGESGQSLGDVWDSGAKALRSVAVSGFPNYFMLIGPHSPIGNFSLTGISEIQMRYIMKFVRMIKNGEAKAVDPKPSAQDRYNQHIVDGFAGTQWVTGCSSWYLDKNGLPRMYPFTPDQYRIDMSNPDVSEFVVTSDTPRPVAA
ncbi:MAG TPA: NAD(P)/FAD-dependent oxidoreductase [Nevskiaceae bacterium]|nr:NAD(P)/FAD-dependent oxidoreductase [Nevskiaceae bacterium]